MGIVRQRCFRNLMPQFIDNKSILLRDKLKQLQREADDVFFALAFVRQSGLNILIHDISELRRRNGKLHVLFANDFGATEPDAIVSLQEVGAEMRFFSSHQSFHPKAYIFKKANDGHVIIGSSNLSASGLSTGVEWSISASSNEIDFGRVLNEFNALWTSESVKPITPELIASLSSQVPDREFKRTIIQEDRIPILTPEVPSDNLFDKSKNYVVKRLLDPHPT